MLKTCDSCGEKFDEREVENGMCAGCRAAKRDHRKNAAGDITTRQHRIVQFAGQFLRSNIASDEDIADLFPGGDLSEHDVTDAFAALGVDLNA